MKRILILSALAVAVPYLLGAQTLNVASYNIRLQTKSDYEHGDGWTQRVDALCDVVRFSDFDIFGAQEVRHVQLEDMLERLPGYAYVGVGRDDGEKGGEYSPVFYKRERLKLLDGGTFWLSETPDRVSKGWDAVCMRICSWGHFEDRATGCRFWFFNLHMDHRGKVARHKSAELVLERQTETPAWQLPPWTKLLTGGIDVQENCMYWTIRAWGNFMTSQCVAHGQALSGEEVERVMNAAFQLPSGERMRVALALMDSSDQTDTVYEFCLMNLDWVAACKGSSKPLPGYYKISVVDKPDSRANGMQLIIIDTGKYKDMISARMRRPNGSGSWMVHKDCDLEYAQQVTSEHKVTERSNGRQVQRWVPKSTHAANHYLDCEVYAACAADLKEVRMLFLQSQPQPAPKPKPAPQPTPEEDWIGQHENWI